MSAIAITVNAVSKHYFSYEGKWSQLMHALTPATQVGVSQKMALNDINFEVSKGEAVGIIGRNGCGKSTLLQIITGTLKPTTGKVNVIGRVAALLELGSGFNPEFSGRENVFLNSMLMGLSRAETETRFHEITAFADIGNVLDQPVKTYSSGMLIRLAFSVQVALKPDVLIVDEALSVGDYFFRQKCYQRIAELRESGMTLLFVTHDMNTVSSICDRALYLHNGYLLHDGKPNRAIRAYLGQAEIPLSNGEDALAKTKSSTPLIATKSINWSAAESQTYERGGVESVTVLDDNDEPVSNIGIGDKIGVRIRFVPDPEMKAHVYIQIRNVFNEIVFTSGSYFLNVSIFNNLVTKSREITFHIEMNLGGGEYSLRVLTGVPMPPNGIGEIISTSGPLGPIAIGGDYSTTPMPFLGPFGLPINAELTDV